MMIEFRNIFVFDHRVETRQDAAKSSIYMNISNHSGGTLSIACHDDEGNSSHVFLNRTDLMAALDALDLEAPA